MNFFVLLMGAVGLAAGMLFASRTLIHYFQLESYQFSGYYRTVKRKWLHCFRPGFIMAAIWIVVCLIVKNVFWRSLILLAAMPAAGYFIGKWCDDKKAKKPLGITARIKRLCGISAGIYLVLAMLLGNCGKLGFQVLAIFLLVLPAMTALGGLVAWPVEKVISELYFRDAQKMLKKRPDLIKIGITGSYGKTSVKFILGTLLAEKYQVLVTPSSFNTPMGLTKVIRTQLNPSHQIFVAEMGARHVGDIKELCRLVHPQYGVLTSVGPQHLDTFHTIDRIKSTKYELMDAIPKDGSCFFPNDEDICLELYQKTTKSKHICSLNEIPDADVWAENIKVNSRGSSFDLCTTNGRINCETRLLGAHNIQNILLAANVSLELGLTLKQISRGIEKLQPVEHRLQLIDNPGGMTIIDDAFNSNPNGANCALDVLKQFTGRRIIITPGMVELGEKEAEFNQAFGEKMADCTDIAILVGRKHSQPIADGLKKAGFDESNLYMTGSLNEAAEVLRKIGIKGDTVLFENDLPDNYSE